MSASEGTFRYTPKNAPISVQKVFRERHYVHRYVHMHGHTELLLITSPGRVLISNNGNHCEVNTPALVLHQAGSYHSTDTLEIGSEGYSSYCVFFYEQSVKLIPRSLLNGDPLFDDQCLILELTEQQNAVLSRYAELLRGETENGEKALLLLLLLLAETKEAMQKNSVIRLNNPNDYIFDVTQYLVEHFEDSLTAAQIAAHFHVSVSKLTADFQKITNQTPKQFSVNLRVSRAAELLRSQPKMQIAEIAYQCGFSSESYFIQSFQKKTGTTPNAYRKANSHKSF
ncbi:MAG: helix-turn-helix transcriptional regulator [Clostridia bacterium]|nr:helix-turn-helix transcriptional regulator [Clostridia bacterium]